MRRWWSCRSLAPEKGRGLRRRRRALMLLGAAGICALFTLIVTSRLQHKVTSGYGPMREAVVLSGTLAQGQEISRQDATVNLTVRRIPVLFIPPGTLSATATAIGLRAAVDLAPGTYLQESLLDRSAPGASLSPVRSGRRPVEVSVAGAGALTLGADMGGGIPVDVVVSGQSGIGRGRAEVIASAAPLIRLAKPSSPGEGWKATVAVSRGEALRLIAAEAAGRSIRLLPLQIASG